eukprot:TRINITY_DN1620_c0_g1_i5.p1 TRINITY_DN1620_c0_g1~~TRINITY_DN1620_c0_g1_i5.p1  ORF type:complete len:234 (-),score=48.09 TRINITY_DN1620_c0_g1_i5:212-913(-)
MSGKTYNSCIVLIKLHYERCVLHWPDLHFGKSTRKKSKQYKISCNTAYEQVVLGCVEQHGDDWLCPPLRHVFIYMNKNPHLFHAKMNSIELWKGDELVAGELGYVVGGIYTSQTGFYKLSGTGTIQLCSLGKLLEMSGVVLWDFGMAMDYKMGLGGVTLPREEWLKFVVNHRRDVLNPFPGQRGSSVGSTEGGEGGGDGDCDVSVGVDEKGLLICKPTCAQNFLRLPTSGKTD